MPRLARIGLAVLLGLALTPALGRAAAVSDGFGIVYDDDSPSGQANAVTMFVAADDLVHFSDTAGLTPSGNCTANGGNGAICPFPDATYILVRLAGGIDSFTANTIHPLALDAGPGNDTISGGSGDDLLSGSSGNDTISGNDGNDLISDLSNLIGVSGATSQGNDTESGGHDNDTIIAGPGADTIDGGTGTDTLDYSARSTATHVTVGVGGPDDGAAGELDEVKSIEVLLGGSGPDSFTASPASSTLSGNGGDDALTGGAGNDKLLGGDNAGSGNDTLDGGAGADEMRGGDGSDTVTYANRTAGVTVSPDDVADDGEPGEGDNVRSDVESFIGGAGDDAFKLRDGRAETVACGGGTDSVVADALDTIGTDCETVDVPPPPATTGASDGQTGGQTGGTQNPPPAVIPALTLPSGKVKPDKRRRITLKLSCSAGVGGCAGKLLLKSGKRTAATAFYVLGAGKRTTVRVSLPRSVVRRGGTLSLRASPQIGTVPAPTKLTLPKRK